MLTCICLHVATSCSPGEDDSCQRSLCAHLNSCQLQRPQQTAFGVRQVLASGWLWHGLGFRITVYKP